MQTIYGSNQMLHIFKFLWRTKTALFTNLTEGVVSRPDKTLDTVDQSKLLIIYLGNSRI